MTAVIRLRQGVRALIALIFAPSVDYDAVARALTLSQVALFKRLQRAEQLHSLRVLRAVLAQDTVTPPALAVAALLHDIGKVRYPVGLIGKMLPVLVKRISPRLVRRLSDGNPENRFIRPFVVYLHHPAWSSELITKDGGSPDAAWLAAHHADDADRWRNHPLYAQILRLQAADDRN